MVNYLKKKYKLLPALNQTWESDFKSWDELIENTELFTNAKDDIRLISGLVAEKYFRQCKDALKVAPEKLYLGCRFDFHFYPEKIHWLESGLFLMRRNMLMSLVLTGIIILAIP